MGSLIEDVISTREPEPRAASCPRCGYDQRGAMAAWRGSCPLEGVCAECGLAFEWADLLDPRRSIPDWSVESIGSERRMPAKVVRTFLRTFWPFGFWSSLKMSHAVSARGLAVYVLVQGAALYLAFAIGNALQAVTYFHFTVSTGGGGTTASTGAWVVFGQALLLPFSSTSIGAFAMAGANWGPYPYPTPLDYASFTLGFTLPALVWGLVFQCCCPLGFVALPVSRRVAKVKWRHVMRVAVYGLAVLNGLLMFWMLTPAMQYMPSRWGAVWTSTLAVGPFAALLMYYVHWSTATSRYLRMRHPWGVGLAVIVMALLAPPAVVTFIATAFW